MGRFWWDKGVRRKRIHWCCWYDLCIPKEFEGMGLGVLQILILRY